MLESQLDKLFQQYACLQKSAYSRKPAECGHHIIPRRYKLTRWITGNCYPCTLQEHILIHEGKIKVKVTETLEKLKQVNFKNYLLQQGITEQDFMLKQKQILTREIEELKCN